MIEHCRRFGLPPDIRRLAGVGLLLLSTTACGKDPIGPTPTPPQTGQLAFSSTATRGWSTITVSVDGRTIGTVTAVVSNTTASCTPSNGRVVVAVAPGTHTFSASSNTLATWSGTVDVAAGACNETQLTCRNDDCSPDVSPPPSGTPRSNLSFQGHVGYQTSGSSVTLTIDKIVNNSSTRTTGSLRIELWATRAPYTGGQLSGRRTASVRTANIPGLEDRLAPRASFSNITINATYTRPPSEYGEYTMVLSEFSEDCTADDHYCVTAYVPMQ